MKQYLVILLDDTSTSYCQYHNTRVTPRLIPLDYLQRGILWAMKENLMIQCVLPSYQLPPDYINAINSIDHHLIVPSNCEDPNAIEAADIIVFNQWEDIHNLKLDSEKSYILRISKDELFKESNLITDILPSLFRLNITITDVERFTDEDCKKYKSVLDELINTIEQEYVNDHSVQLNILTDRMMLTTMNNCGAGDTCITLAPDGKFYPCPAFYYAQPCDGNEASLGDLCTKGYDIGSLDSGLQIHNQRLYKLDSAPLCRKCDAYQCKRCVWLSRKMTFELNTPSHQQCIVSHLERNASRKLLQRIRAHGCFLPDHSDIPEIDYLDPFEVRDKY